MRDGMSGLDRHITGNYGEDSVGPDPVNRGACRCYCHTDAEFQFVTIFENNHFEVHETAIRAHNFVRPVEFTGFACPEGCRSDDDFNAWDLSDGVTCIDGTLYSEPDEEDPYDRPDYD